MEQFYMVRKYEDRWLVTGTDNRPIWERWGGQGEYRSTYGEEPEDQ